ncbi:hypothetical protein ABVF11_02275 [Pediococcus argentinicus]|uniref:hypothetical protein n=1 Tax=Pediococcus argentinicus TaxID=480391 RepID=UPI00338DFEAF
MGAINIIYFIFCLLIAFIFLISLAYRSVMWFVGFLIGSAMFICVGMFMSNYKQTLIPQPETITTTKTVKLLSAIKNPMTQADVYVQTRNRHFVVNVDGNYQSIKFEQVEFVNSGKNVMKITQYERVIHMSHSQLNRAKFWLGNINYHIGNNKASKAKNIRYELYVRARSVL